MLRQSVSPRWWRRWQGHGARVVALLFMLLFVLRMQLLQHYASLLDCGQCLPLAALGPELQLLLGLFLAHGVATRYLVRGARLVRGGIVLCLVIVALDYWVLKNFLVRLDWREAYKFAGDGQAALALMRTWWQQHGVLQALLTMGMVMAGMAALLNYILLPHLSAPAPQWLLLAGLCLAAIPLVQPAPNYHHRAVRHALAAFFDPPTVHQPYSREWIVQKRPDLQRWSRPAHCVAPVQGEDVPLPPKAVIMVAVESLSSYHSQHLGGLNDWTPQLDYWLGQGLSFERFLANGKNTEEGLYALLTGRLPLPQTGKSIVYESEHGPEAERPDLPRLLREAGYLTAFMTTGNLGFMNKGQWLKRLGFTEIHGHDAPFYEGMARYHFDAADDDALYQHALQWLQQRSAQDVFLFLETVSSHQPYFDPVARKSSAEGAFRYADAALGRFLRSLRSSGLLEHSLVLVTGDHRAMQPVSIQEENRFGPDAYSRVPMLILGKGIEPGVHSRHASQQDVLPNLQHMLTGQTTCVHPGQNLWWANEGMEASCIFTLRAPDPDRVFLRCADDTKSIALQAEKTRYPAPGGEQKYINEIHAQRALLN